jgi:hypothetical protein
MLEVVASTPALPDTDATAIVRTDRPYFWFIDTC